MAVKMRLKKFGRRHKNMFRLGVMDIRSPRDGRVIEELGWYNPTAKDADKVASLNRERIEHWLSVGAQPSPTVRDLLERNGIGVKK
jgi:small subunit ribosomal protein S16